LGSYTMESYYDVWKFCRLDEFKNSFNKEQLLYPTRSNAVVFNSSSSSIIIVQKIYPF
jgi:hypothetical protein